MAYTQRSEPSPILPFTAFSSYFRTCYELASKYGVSDAKIFFLTFVYPDVGNEMDTTIRDWLLEILESSLKSPDFELSERHDHLAGRLLAGTAKTGSFAVIEMGAGSM